MEEENFRVFLQNFGRIHEFKYFKENLESSKIQSNPMEKHVVIFFHGFYGSQWDFEYIKS